MSNGDGMSNDIEDENGEKRKSKMQMAREGGMVMKTMMVVAVTNTIERSIYSNETSKNI